MAETTTAYELRALTQHLVSQPSSRARLAELVHQMRMLRIPLAYPAELPGDVHPDDVDPEEPLIIHVPGRNPVAVLLAVGLEPPEVPAEDFGTGLVLRPVVPPDALVHELDERGQPRSIYGPGSLTTAAPQAIALRVIRDLHQLGRDLPGHVILVVAPGAATGGTVFEAAGRRVQRLLRAHRLRPLLALVPGRAQPGMVERARSRIVLATGSAGLVTVQLFATGQTAAPSSRFRALDPAGLLTGVVRDLAVHAGIGGGRRLLPQPVIGDWHVGDAPAPGWPAMWAAVRVSMMVADIEPDTLVESLTQTVYQSFQREVTEQNERYARARPRGSGKPDGLGRHLPWQPLAVDYRQLRRTCRYEMPPFQPPPAGLSATQALRWAQDQALRRIRFAYQHSPYAGTPTVVVGLVPPLLPPVALDPESSLPFDALKHTSKEYAALRTSNGLLGDGWHRLALGTWGARPSRSLHEQCPLGDDGAGFGLQTEWGHWPVVGFGPTGRGAGTPSECVDVDPSFTRLPEFLRTLIVRVLALEHRPNLVESTWTRLRRWTSRIGLTRKQEVRDDDDDVLYAGLDESADDVQARPPAVPQPGNGAAKHEGVAPASPEPDEARRPPAAGAPPAE